MGQNANSLVLLLTMIMGAVRPAAAEDAGFRRHVINPESQFSACAAVDVNHDGRLDIVCGAYWYQAPDWQKHATRDVPMIRGRYDDYSNLPLDVNGDGWTDVVSVNYRSKSLYWVEHPGPELGAWKTHLIDSPGSSETGRLADVDGDGQKDVLPNGVSFAAWYRVEPAADGIRWIRHDLPDELIGHGIGFGDVDGDGRGDLVGTEGWLGAPPDRRQGRWMWHGEFQLHRDGSIPILIDDVDQDGDADIIWGRGHNIGLYWLEQQATGEGRVWHQHAIDTSWSCTHSIMLADINGDGRRDLVAGKRYLGHDGKDPGEYDPLAVCWYEFSDQQRTWNRHVVSFGGRCGFDLDPKCVDLDQDGDMDILAPTRGGLCLLENLRIGGNAPSVVELTDYRSVPIYKNRTRLLSLRGASGAESPVTTGFDWGLRRWQILANMQRVMGPMPEPARRVPLDLKVVEEEETETYLRRKVTFVAEPGDRVPAFLLIPKGIKGKTTAALCLHPTSPLGKAQICGLAGKASRFYAHELAERGFICLAPDYPSFGDYEYDFKAASKFYVSGTMKAIWNNIRAVDLLESLAQVDPDRIVCVGHSLGGHNAMFTAAFDQRIRAVVTSCGFNAFEHYYDGDLTGWSSDRYMPLIRTEYGLDPQAMPFDFHDVLAALSPRPVFINAPRGDGNFAVEGVKEAVAAAQAVYDFHQASDRLHVVYPDAEHDFPAQIRQQAYEWLEKDFPH